MIAQPSQNDRILADFRALARAATPELAALYQYDYVVTEVDPDTNTVSGFPFDRSAGLPPLAGIPLRTGVPGATVQPSSGTRFAVGFLDADFTKYVVIGAYDSSQSEVLTLNALAVNLGPTPARQGVVLGQLLAAQLILIDAALSALALAIDNITGGPSSAASCTATQAPLNAAADAAVGEFSASLADPNYSATVEASL